MQLALRTIDLPLKHPFTISRGTVSVQPTLVVELSQNGQTGYGEATTNSYYHATLDNMTAALESVQPALESLSLDDPAALWESLYGQLSANRFAQAALDQAAWDLWGKLQGKPVYELWGLSLDGLPQSSFTIGIDEPDQMVAKLQEEPDWPCYKIKLGTPRDLEIVRALRRHTDAPFRVDANCGWTAEQAIEMSHELETLGVELIEQPLPAGEYEAMRRVSAESVLPLFADESCVTEDDIELCRECFHGINIKLVKCGGLTPARRMSEIARDAGLQVMAGCMTESTIGISALAQLLPMLDIVDMDGAALLSRDIATGVTVDRGTAHFPDRPGTGAKLL